MLLFTNIQLSCICCSDGVSTWAKFDGHIYHGYIACYIEIYLPFIMYYESDREKHVKDLSCCLQTCNSVVYVLLMGLVLWKSLMVISTMGILLYAKVSPFYNVL